MVFSHSNLHFATRKCEPASHLYERYQMISLWSCWFYMGFLNGFIWFYMVLYDFIWFYMVLYGFMCTILWAVFPPRFFPFHIFPPCLCPQRGVKLSSRDVGPILRNFGGVWAPGIVNGWYQLCMEYPQLYGLYIGYNLVSGMHIQAGIFECPL